MSELACSRSAAIFGPGLGATPRATVRAIEDGKFS